MKYLFALVFIMAVGLVIAESAEVSACPAVYDPVCSTSHRTYCNLCRLIVSGAKFAYRGVCRCL
uniref:Protease inhibitor3 n=1 Tax=Samia ricini TaxID=63990 RepID=A0A0M5MSR4_SAMRI|nr:protease inhibitor3 [Samia ricini]